MRKLTQRDLQSAEKHYARIMEILELPEDENSKDTPKRYVKMLSEMTEGVGCDPEISMSVFPNKGDQLVIVAPIPFASLCSHHHASVQGNASIGYLPDKHILGLSKFKRVIDHFGARPQTQEDLACEIADFIQLKLKPKALYVYLDAKHMCMSARGVKTPCSSTVTHAVRGKVGYDEKLKNEFMMITLQKMPRN